MPKPCVPLRYSDVMTPAASSAVPADTTPAAWRAHMRALAAMTPAQRLALWEELNDELEEMEVRAIRRQHPEFTEHELQVEIVRRRHGEALTQAWLTNALWVTR